MGTNQSKLHPIVQQQALAKWHIARHKHDQKCPSENIIQLPVQLLRKVCATSDREFNTDLLERVKRGWTLLCEDHGIHSARGVRRAIVVATAFGALFLWGDIWLDMKNAFCDTDEEWAIRVMWTFEDEVDHPWNILRTFVLHRYNTSKSNLVHMMNQSISEAKRLFKAQVCWHCHKAKLSSCTLRKCSLCRIAKYCSDACQAKDWIHHKQTCAQLHEQPQGTDKDQNFEPDCIDRAVANPQEGIW